MKIKDLGIPTKFIGIKMNWLVNVHVSRSQAPFASKLLQQTAMENVKSVETPFVVSNAYWDFLESCQLSTEDHHKYISPVSTFMYLSIKTRAGLFVAASILGWRAEKPSELDMKCAKNIHKIFASYRGLSSIMAPGCNTQLARMWTPIEKLKMCRLEKAERGSSYYTEEQWYTQLACYKTQSRWVLQRLSISPFRVYAKSLHGWEKY